MMITSEIILAVTVLWTKEGVEMREVGERFSL